MAHILVADRQGTSTDFKEARLAISESTIGEEVGGILAKLERQMLPIAGGSGVDGVLLVLNGTVTELLKTAAALSALIRRGEAVRFLYTAESSAEQDEFPALRKILTAAIPGLIVRISDDQLVANMPDNTPQPRKPRTVPRPRGTALGTD